MIKHNAEALRRHYVHGDQVENSTDTYYCTRCDAFETEKHFSDKEHIEDRAEQYFASLSRWTYWDKSSKCRLRRPLKVVNILQASAAEDVEKYELSKSKFYKWLEKQIKRDEIVGDLSNDILRDKEFPVNSLNLEEIRYRIRFKNGCAEAFVALDEAWDEFFKKSKSRSPISLKMRFVIFKRDMYCCCICGTTASSEIRLEIDHKIPVVKGGTSTEDNLWTLCFNCNRGKGVVDL